MLPKQKQNISGLTSNGLVFTAIEYFSYPYVRSTVEMLGGKTEGKEIKLSNLIEIAMKHPTHLLGSLIQVVQKMASFSNQLDGLTRELKAEDGQVKNILAMSQASSVKVEDAELASKLDNLVTFLQQERQAMAKEGAELSGVNKQLKQLSTEIQQVFEQLLKTIRGLVEEEAAKLFGQLQESGKAPENQKLFVESCKIYDTERIGKLWADLKERYHLVMDENITLLNFYLIAFLSAIAEQLGMSSAAEEKATLLRSYRSLVTQLAEELSRRIEDAVHGAIKQSEDRVSMLETQCSELIGRLINDRGILSEQARLFRSDRISELSEILQLKIDEPQEELQLKVEQ